jgi:sarcosine/dimethylglycine N-methyltransferase
MICSAMSSMYKYRVSRIWQELAAGGKQNSELTINDLVDLDQFHYLGSDAIATAANKLELSQPSVVLDIGSGVGGTARCLVDRYGCKVTALELQDDLHQAAVKLTELCGLDRHVDCVQGNILEFEPEFTFDAWISLLVFLHIGDRRSLFAKAAKLLKPGGRFYIEDYFARNPLSTNDRVTLQGVVACPLLPTRDRYLTDLAQAGFIEVEFEEVTDKWQPWVQNRFDQFVAMKEHYLALHGAEMVESQTTFYQAIANLFEDGNVGGARIWGKIAEDSIVS